MTQLVASIAVIQETVRNRLMEKHHTAVDAHVQQFVAKALRSIVRAESEKRAEVDPEIGRLRKRIKSIHGFLQFPKDLAAVWGAMSPRGNQVVLLRKVGDEEVNEL